MDLSFDVGKLDFSIDYFVNRKCTPQWNLSESVIDFHNLMYLYEGKCDFYIDGNKYILEKGDIVYAHEGIVRKANTYENDLMQCYALSFHISNIPCGLQILPPYLKIGKDDELLMLFRQLEQIWLEKEDGHLLKCRALFMLVIYKLLQTNKNLERNVKEDFRINQAKQFMSENLTRNITVAKLADIVGLNPAYFGNIFKNYTGITVKEYLNRLRIRKSCDILSTSGHTVKEAAYQSGFDDIYYFSKTFKKIVGIPPSIFTSRAQMNKLEL